MGVLVVRRPSRAESGSGSSTGSSVPELAYRWTRATWAAPTSDRLRQKLPCLELHPAAAERLLGFDPLDWASKVDRSGRAKIMPVPEVGIELSSATRPGPVPLHNVVGELPGSDPRLRDEAVMLGAHLDHIGVGPRERVGRGADDNASGVAAMMEVAEALALAAPRRSVLFAGFSGEEDGLLGSAALAADLPWARGRLVAMVNLDMVGRGAASKVVALGFRPNPGFRDVLHRAQKLGRSGIRDVKDCRDEALFKRSDHYSFHEVGVPSLFLFENYPLESNRDYHTWRDLPEGLDFKKIRNTARLAYLATWVLANDDQRLEAPR